MQIQDFFIKGDMKGAISDHTEKLIVPNRFLIRDAGFRII